MFSYTLLSDYRQPFHILSDNIMESDTFFDSIAFKYVIFLFFYSDLLIMFVNSCFVKPRDWATWKICRPQVPPMQPLSDYAISQAVLSGPFWYSPVPALSSTCHSLSPLPASSPIPQSSSPTWLDSPLSPINDLDDILLEKEIISSFLPESDNIHIIDTNFDIDLPANHISSLSSHASHKEKFEYTEELRNLAKNAVIPTSLAELKDQVCDNFFLL